MRLLLIAPTFRSGMRIIHRKKLWASALSFFALNFSFFVLLILFSEVHAQVGGTAGAFSRIGFGSRGIAMGNAMTAVTDGEISSYYNPAVITFQNDRTLSLGFTSLSLDRSLNFLYYSQPLKNQAGISIGFINSGVSNIDGRDDDGHPTGMRSVTENLIFASFAKQIMKNFSAGLTFRLYYYRLYDGMVSTAAGLDLGILYTISHDLRVGATIQDINSKYRWDSGNLYGDEGVVTIDQFPLTTRIGGSYTLVDSTLTLALDFVMLGSDTKLFRGGVEWTPISCFSIRAGIDRLFLNDQYGGSTPTFGFALHYPVGGIMSTLNYSYGIEPFAPQGIHMITGTVEL